MTVFFIGLFFGVLLGFIIAAIADKWGYNPF